MSSYCKWPVLANLLRYSNISIILKLKGLLKRRLILRILNLLQNLSSSLKIIRWFVKVDRNVSNTADKSASTDILIKSCFLAIGSS